MNFPSGLCLISFIACNLVLSKAYYIEEYSPKNDPSTEDFPPSLSLKLDLQNGENAWVFDNVIPFSMRYSVKEFLSGQIPYFALANYSWTQKNGESNIGLSPWISKIEIKSFKKMPFWKKLAPLLEKTMGGKITIERVQKEISHSLDPRPPVTPQYCSKNRYIAMLYSETFWEKNNYGQLSFLTELINKNVSSESRLEIVETVHPRRGRLVVYPSCQKIIMHPPTPSYFKRMYLINIWFTPEEAKQTNAPSSFIDNVMPLSKVDDSFEKFKFDPERKVDIENCVTRKFVDSTGERALFVLDGVFTVEELRTWREHLITHSRVQVGEFDSATLEDNDNVASLTQYPVYGFMKTDMWKRVHEQISFVSGEDKWHPYDVAMNYIQSSDHTRIHPDAEHHQFEYTYLLYLTEGIESKHFGETIWVELKDSSDGITQFTRPGGEEYEPFAAVKPKFGRVAIFRNIIEHSARPLNTAYLGDRYTFAVKVGRDKRKALVKLCYESFDFTGITSPKMVKLNRQLQMGMHDDENKSKISTEFLEKLYEKWGAKKMELASPNM